MNQIIILILPGVINYGCIYLFIYLVRPISSIPSRCYHFWWNKDSHLLRTAI